MVEVETDLFYGLYVKWEYHSGGLDQPVTDYYDENVVCFKKDVFDHLTRTFFTRDKDEIKLIANYFYYSQIYDEPDGKVYSSEITQKDEAYEYVIYVVSRSGGDWGMRDAIVFSKVVAEIDINTGEMRSVDYEDVGTVYGYFTRG